MRGAWASSKSEEPWCRSMVNWRVGPGRVWLNRPRSTGSPLVGGCTREAELETASVSRDKASFHSWPCRRGRVRQEQDKE